MLRTGRPGASALLRPRSHCMGECKSSGALILATLMRPSSFVCLALILLTLFVSETVRAQHYTVTGSVADSSGTSLSQATVVALHRTDSTLVSFSTSRSDGHFTLRRRPRQKPVRTLDTLLLTALNGSLMAHAMRLKIGVFWPPVPVLCVAAF